MAQDCFVSYSAEDKAEAEAACSRLESTGIRCWIAPRDVTPGKPYAAEIIEAIGESKVMIFVFSSQSNASPHVLRELEAAVRKHVCVIPFRIEDVHPSPSIEYFISAAHWLDAAPKPTEQHYEILAQAVQKLLAKEGGEVELATPKDRAELMEHKPPEGGGGTPRPVPKEQPPRNELNDFEIDMRLAEGHLKKKEWASCVRECGALFEKTLRELLGDLLDSIEDKAARDQILEAQSKLASGKSAFQRLGLAQLMRVYTEGDVFDELRKHLTSNLQKIRRINWDQVVEWYEQSRHTPSSIDHDDAAEMAYWVKVFLHDCELAGDVAGVGVVCEEARSPEQCPLCAEDLMKEWSFCPACGAPVKVTCEACHRALAPDFKICPYCETPVRGGARGMGPADRAQEEYRILSIGAYLDGVVNLREKKMLNRKRLELGLSTEEAERIERQCAPENVLEYAGLVEGVLVDGVISEQERAFLDKHTERMGLDRWIVEEIEKVGTAMRKGVLGEAK